MDENLQELRRLASRANNDSYDCFSKDSYAFGDFKSQYVDVLAQLNECKSLLAPELFQELSGWASKAREALGTNFGEDRKRAQVYSHAMARIRDLIG